MSLYLVMYFYGAVAGYAGPLPYDLAECEVRAAEMRTEVAGKEVDRRGRVVRGEDFKFTCEWLFAPPTIEGQNP
jgi:hypothetical protein